MSPTRTLILVFTAYLLIISMMVGILALFATATRKVDGQPSDTYSLTLLEEDGSLSTLAEGQTFIQCKNLFDLIPRTGISCTVEDTTDGQ